MPKYVIERELPGAGQLSPAELHDVSCQSNQVLMDMGGRAQWLQTYVTDDRLFCVYIADDPEAVREHGSRGGFPVTAVHRVRTVIDPSTGDAT